MHRDDRRRGQPIAEALEITGRDDVVGADHRAPRLVILDARQSQPGRRIDHGKVGADLVKALIEQLRHHRGRTVERVFALPVPEIGLRNTPLGPLGRGHLQPLAGTPWRKKAVGRLVAADLAHLLGEDRWKLDPMAVTVDDRMLDLGVDLRGAQMTVAAHGVLPKGGDETSSNVDRESVSRALELSQMQPRHSRMTRRARLAIDKNKDENEYRT